MDDKIQAERLYQAESWIDDELRGTRFRTIREVRDWLDEIFATPWFQHRYRFLRGYDLRDGRGARRGIGSLLPGNISRITLPRGLRCELFVLHELAHSVSFDGHGPHFVFEYVHLVRRFIGRETAAELRSWLKCTKARQRRPPEYDHHGTPRYLQIQEQRRQCRVAQQHDRATRGKHRL